MLDVVTEDNNSGRNAPGAEMSALLTPPLEAGGYSSGSQRQSTLLPKVINQKNQNQPTKKTPKENTNPVLQLFVFL